MVDLLKLSKIIGGVVMNLNTQQANNITFNSRIVKRNDLFWALRGKRVEGNDFVYEAMKNGAAAVVTNNISFNGPAIFVDNTYAALLVYVKYLRAKFIGKVITVTGSVGKTTTRHYITKMLSFQARADMPDKNYNNEFGVPMSMLKLADDYDYFVAELGGAQAQDISILSKIIKPDIGIITNIGHTHMLNLEDVASVFRMKMGIADGMQDGTLLVNKDCIFFKHFPTEIRNIRIKSYSLHDRSADYYLSGDTFYKERCRSAHISAAAVIFNAYSLCVSLAVCDIFHIALSDMGKFYLPQIQGRFNISKKGNTVYIDDSYNSNPESLIFGLNNLRKYREMNKVQGQQLVLILGDMLELGKSAQKLHNEVAENIEKAGADVVVLMGDLMPKLNIRAGSIYREKGLENLQGILDREDMNNAVIYFKASNAVGLFNFVKEKVMGGADAIQSFISIT